MTATNKLLGAALALVLMASSAVASAGGGGPFSAEIDCGGGGQVFAPGDMVPFTIRLENQTLQQQQMNIAMRINIAGLATFTVFQTPLALGPNQDIVFTRDLTLPPNAPNGSYTLVVLAATGAFFTFDTCSFNVMG